MRNGCFEEDSEIFIFKVIDQNNFKVPESMLKYSELSSQLKLMVYLVPMPRSTSSMALTKSFCWAK